MSFLEISYLIFTVMMNSLIFYHSRKSKRENFKNNLSITYRDHSNLIEEVISRKSKGLLNLLKPISEKEWFSEDELRILNQEKESIVLGDWVKIKTRRWFNNNFEKTLKTTSTGFKIFTESMLDELEYKTVRVKSVCDDIILLSNSIHEWNIDWIEKVEYKIKQTSLKQMKNEI